MAEQVSRGASTTASTCSSRPAPAPASRWPTSCRRCSTTSGSSSPPRPSPCSTSSSSATSRGWSRRSRRPGSTRRTPCSRAAPTTPACTASARASPTTRARSSTCRPGRWPRRCSSCGRGPRRRPRPGGSGERDNAPRHTDREWRQVSVSHRECLGATQVPVRRGVLRRAGAREGPPQPPDRHQPLAARDRRDRGRADDPRLRRGRDRRGPRAHRPGHPGRDRRARASTTSSGRPGARQRWVDGRRPGRRPRRRRRRAGRGDRRDVAGPDRRGPRPARRRAGAGARRGPRLPLGLPARSTPARARATPAAPRPRAWCRRSSSTPSGWRPTSRADVLWLSEARDRIPARLHVAPLQVWGPMRDKLLTDKTVVFTSATLMLGGDFNAVATSLGLKPTERDRPPSRPDDDTRCRGAGIDVGSPFDYGQQAILYVARHLPPPGRDGLGQGPARRDLRAGRRRRRAHARPVLLPPRRRDRGRGGARAAAPPDHARPGRRAAARARASSSSRTRTPASSARSRCGRASTCRARPASW